MTLYPKNRSLFFDAIEKKQVMDMAVLDDAEQIPAAANNKLQAGGLPKWRSAKPLGAVHGLDKGRAKVERMVLKLL